MTLRALRVVFCASAALAFGLGLFAFLAAPEAGSIYRRLVGGPGMALPAPTVEVALPLLRFAPGGRPHETATTPAASAVWFVLLAGPWAILAAALRAPDVPAGLARWVAGWSLYLALAAAVVAAVLLGLLLPFVPL